MEPLTRSIEALGSEVYGVLARGIDTRLIEISRSGCLLESRYPVDVGVIGELRLDAGGELIADDVRVTRCIRVEGSGSSYLVGAEFVQTRRAGDGSIRRAIGGILRALMPQSKLHTPSKNKGSAVAARRLSAPRVNHHHDVNKGEET